jgi:hypothetical protein
MNYLLGLKYSFVLCATEKRWSKRRKTDFSHRAGPFIIRTAQLIEEKEVMTHEETIKKAGTF